MDKDKIIGQCSLCGENLTSYHKCHEFIKQITTKFGPCPICFSHIKPCRCEIINKISLIINYLEKQYTCGDHPMGSDAWENGYSPEDRIKETIKNLKKLI